MLVFTTLAILAYGIQVSMSVNMCKDVERRTKMIDDNITSSIELIKKSAKNVDDKFKKELDHFENMINNGETISPEPVQDVVEETTPISIITDNTVEQIVTAQDKNGNTIYYKVDENGKKQRVSKSIAEEKIIIPAFSKIEE